MPAWWFLEPSGPVQSPAQPGGPKQHPAFKTFLHMGIHSLGVLRLTQDLQQVVVGQEKETWEEQSLGLQVVIQTSSRTIINFCSWRPLWDEGWRLRWKKWDICWTTCFIDLVHTWALPKKHVPTIQVQYPRLLIPSNYMDTFVSTDEVNNYNTRWLT